MYVEMASNEDNTLPLDHLRSFISQLLQLTSCVTSNDIIYLQTQINNIEIFLIFQTAFA